MRATYQIDTTSIQSVAPSAIGGLSEVWLCSAPEEPSAVSMDLSAPVYTPRPVKRWRREHIVSAATIVASIATAVSPALAESTSAPSLAGDASDLNEDARDIVRAIVRAGRVLAESVSQESDHAFDLMLNESIAAKKKTIISKRR